MVPNEHTGGDDGPGPAPAALRDRFVTAALRDPLVSPSGDRVAYLDHADGHPELWVTDGDDRTRLTDGELRGMATGGTDYRWAADGEAVFVVAAPGDDPERAAVRRFGLDGSSETVGRVGAFVSLLAATADGSVTYVDNYVTGAPPGRLCRLSPSRSRTVVDDDAWVRGGVVGPDGDAVALQVHDPDGSPPTVVHVAAADGSERRPVDADGPLRVAAWRPDGEALLGSRPGEGTVEASPDGAVQELDGTEDCVAVGYRADGTALVRETDTGAVRPPDGDPLLTDATAADARDGTLAAVRETDASVALVVNGETVLNRDRRVRDPPSREVAVSCPDGEERTAVLYEPSGDTDRAVVWPYTVATEPYAPDLFTPARSLLVDRGFALLTPANRGHGGSEPAETDVAAAGEWLREHGYERLAVVGHSSGGTDACLQATWHPSVWDAAVAWNAVTDLLAQDAYEGGRENLFRGTLGDPETNEDRWRELSPVAHASDLGTPLLLVHSEHDSRVPPAQSAAMCDALDAAGFERGGAFEHRVVPDEWHATHDADSRARRWASILAFLERRFGADA
jgi:dipeptidyl aminopeptidase/acylaminoacyl peptidase